MVAAGAIGIGVAIIHGMILQRHMIARIEGLIRADGGMTGSLRRLFPVLLQFSTFNWFVSGLALIAAALWMGPEARLATGLLAGSSYLYGAVGTPAGSSTQPRSG